MIGTIYLKMWGGGPDAEQKEMCAHDPPRYTGYPKC